MNNIHMTKTRLEAFSDGVLAIIITIMVLEMKVPHGTTFNDLLPLAPVFLSYVLSFVYIGIYWNNHHHMIHTVQHVNGAIMWSNLHLLFWLSLFPFVTGWMGENHFASMPTTLYGTVLLLAACAWKILQASIIKTQGEHSLLEKAVGKDTKGNLSLLLYACGMLLAFWQPLLSMGLYIGVALMWLIPDRRIEKALGENYH